MLIWLLPLAVLPFIPAGLETMVLGRLDQNAIRHAVGVRLRSEGIRLESSSLEYRLLDGLVFRDLRVSLEQGGNPGETILEADSLEVDLSLLELLSDRTEIDGLLLRNVHATGSDVSPQATLAFIRTLLLLEFQPIGTISWSPGLLITLKNLSVGTRLPDSGGLAPGEQLNLDLAALRSGSGFRLQGELQGEIDHRSDARVRFRGDLAGDGRLRLELRYEQLPAERLLLALADAGAPGLFAAGHGLAMERGLLAGTGSLDYYGPGVGLNLTGQCRARHVALQHNGLALLKVEEPRADIHLNLGWPVGGDGPSFARIAWNSPGFELQADYRRSSQDSAAHRSFHMQSLIEPGPAVQPTPGNFGPGGQIGVDLTVDGAPSALLPAGRISLEGVTLLIPGTGGSVEEFRINGSAETSGPATARVLEISGRGELRNANLDLKARVNPGLLSTGDLAGPALTAQGDTELTIRGLQSDRLADLVLGAYEALMTAARQPDADRVENHGPLWQARFNRTDLYRTYLEGLRLNLTVRLEHPGEEPWPELLIWRGRVDRNGITLELPETRAEGFSARMRYSLIFTDTMPHHDLSANLRLDQNRDAWTALTGSDLVPSFFRMNYSAYADGWLPADLLHLSFSNLTVEAGAIGTSDERINQLLSYAAALDTGTPTFERVRLQRTTDGARVRFDVRAEAQTFQAFGEGEYTPGQGGSATLRLTSLNQDVLPHPRLTLSILPDGRWTPDF
ncbi:MAG: hypothetical protein H7A21_02895 [Spirochaetales bacterium]|nr:hypothetical protein [Leptospiraceae bacterium]MCP5480357.1 hypothetical protein [Spirochaetales bacterium]